MQAHLRLHFETEEASDENVLQAYPTTIRCADETLEHLYESPRRPRHCSREEAVLPLGKGLACCEAVVSAGIHAQ